MSSVTLAPRALRLGAGDDAEELPLLAGAMHYFRVARPSWAKCLKAVRSLGFGIVESYVPWGVHEVRRGTYDFGGQRDLGGFLDAAAAEGLKVILRPGPHINAELTFFGLPERIFAEEKMLARTARGTKVALLLPPRGFPVPSYASSDFLAEVADFYRAVGEVVAPRLYPRGPVIALQVDNEMPHFFRGGAFDGDYHDEAVARFREQHAGADPPRRFAARAPGDLAPILDWLRFREREVGRALSSLSSLLDQAGLAGVPRFHNFPPAEPTTWDVPSTEAVLDFAGVDFYQSRRQYAITRQRALYLAGSSRLPFAPELGIGSFPWGPPLDERDAEAQLLAALMHGVAGYNAYMLVERDRWYGSPIGPDGIVRRGVSDTLRRVNAALRERGWISLARRAEVAVVLPRSYRRLALAASHLGPVGPAFSEWFGIDEAAQVREDHFGWGGPVALEQAEARAAILTALDHHHVPYVIVDGSASLEQLAARRALIVPTFDFLETDLSQRLRRFAEGGGQVLSGPRAPRLDERMAPHAHELPGERFDAEELADPAQLATAIARLLARSRLERPIAAREPDVDVTVHEREGGGGRLLFAATRGAAPTTATIALGRAGSAEDVCDGARFSGETLTIPLPPHGVRMLTLD